MVKSYQNESDFLGELVRSFNNLDDFYLNSYSRYGCWCYLGLEYNIMGMDKLYQSAPPVNQVDTFCHHLHNGYECIDIDSRNTLSKNSEKFNLIPEDQSNNSKNLCHSRTVDYNLPTLTNQIWLDNKQSLTNKLVKEACDSTNIDSCSSKTCQIELHFVIKMMKWQKSTLLGIENPEMDKFLHVSRGGSFDPNSECKVVESEKETNNACCGEFPNAEPYRYIPDKQECCNSVVYNPQYLTCKNSRRLILAI